MISNQSISDDLEAFFMAIVQGEEHVISHLNCGGDEVSYSGGVFSFTLRGIHHVLYPGGAVSFEQFRGVIYASRINERLKRRGCSVEIRESSGKLEGAWYYLRNPI